MLHSATRFCKFAKTPRTPPHQEVRHLDDPSPSSGAETFVANFTLGPSKTFATLFKSRWSSSNTLKPSPMGSLVASLVILSGVNVSSVSPSDSMWWFLLSMLLVPRTLASYVPATSSLRAGPLSQVLRTSRSSLQCLHNRLSIHLDPCRSRERYFAISLSSYKSALSCVPLPIRIRSWSCCDMSRRGARSPSTQGSRSVSFHALRRPLHRTKPSQLHRTRVLHISVLTPMLAQFCHLRTLSPQLPVSEAVAPRYTWETEPPRRARSCAPTCSHESLVGLFSHAHQSTGRETASLDPTRVATEGERRTGRVALHIHCEVAHNTWRKTKPTTPVGSPTHIIIAVAILAQAPDLGDSWAYGQLKNSWK